MLRQIVYLAVLCATFATATAQTREEKVLADRKKVEAEGFWIYGDWAKGLTEAKQSNKPLLVVLRCIPCEECVKLDDEVIHQHPLIQQLLKEFVCVRIVSTNGLDLSLFQFDYDQSFAAFMLNADGAIYGRFGTRSHRTSWAGDVSVEGLAQALKGALELHRAYPQNREQLALKKGPPPQFASPDKYPSLKDKYGPAITYEAKVVQSCIHCHQVGDAQRELFRAERKPLPEELLFPYPHPKVLGLIFDPQQSATLELVESDSLAAAAGFQAGDVILELQRQPLLSIADVQWVLDRTPPDGATLKAKILRDGRERLLTLDLPAGWRRRGQIDWRVSTWGLRRMATGGLVLEAANDEQRAAANVSDNAMALHVKYVGQYGPHAAGKQAGFQTGDILVSFDGQTNLLREDDLLAYALTHCQVGTQVPVEIMRGGKKETLRLPMQD